MRTLFTDNLPKDGTIIHIPVGNSGDAGYFPGIDIYYNDYLKKYIVIDLFEKVNVSGVFDRIEIYQVAHTDLYSTGETIFGRAVPLSTSYDKRVAFPRDLAIFGLNGEEQIKINEKLVKEEQEKYDYPPPSLLLRTK